MCFGGGGSSGSQTVNNVTKLPDYVERGGENLFNQAKGIAGQPYQPYTAPRIADLSVNQKQAIYDASRDAGSFNPAFDKAGELATYASTPFDFSKLDSYMNPYVERALGTAERKVQEQYDRDSNDLAARAVAAGGLGGDRQQVLQGELAQAKAETVGDIYLQGMTQAFDRGVGNMNTDRELAMRGAGTLAGLESGRSDLRSDDMSRLLMTGELARSLPQSSLDLAYQDFLTQTGDPYERINWQTGVLSGQPYGRTTTSETSGGGSSGGQGLLGLGLAGAGLFNMFT